MTDTYCHRCNRVVPRFKADYKYGDGTTFRRAGTRMGAIQMAQFDPSGKFCTVRCAIRWAIEHAPIAREQSR